MKLILISLLCFCSSLWASPLRISGIFVSQEVQDIFPLGINWNYVVEYLPEEGSRVKKGDFVLELQEKKEDWQERWQTEIETDRIRMNQELHDKENAWKKSIENVKKQEQALEILLQEKGSQEGDDLNISQVQKEKNALDLKKEQMKLEFLKNKEKIEKEKFESYKRYFKSYEKEVALDWARWNSDPKNAKHYAQIEGVVSYYKIRGAMRKGSEVYRTTPVISIMNDKKLEVKAFLMEKYFHDIKEGDFLNISLKGKSLVQLKGKVRRKSSQVKTAGSWVPTLDNQHPLWRLKCFLLEIELDSLPPEAQPGGEVFVELEGKGN